MTDIAKELQWCIDDGCIDYTHRFGCIRVPSGYSILLNSDHSHFFYLRHIDLFESAIHWSRFALLRWIKAEVKTLADAETKG